MTDDHEEMITITMAALQRVYRSGPMDDREWMWQASLKMDFRGRSAPIPVGCVPPKILAAQREEDAIEEKMLEDRKHHLPITPTGVPMLGFLCERVARMRPHERLMVTREQLREIPSFEHNGALFRPEDRILENIVGSAYTHSYYHIHGTGDVVFCRHERIGERRYTSPDQRGG